MTSVARSPGLPPKDGRLRHPAVVALLLTALTAVAFADTLANVFALDDAYRVVGNPGIRSVQPWWRHFGDVRTMATLPTLLNYRPLLPLTLSFNYAVGGLDPTGYHVVNIALQAAATVTTFGCIRQLLLSHAAHAQSATTVAGAVAAVFAVHPVSGIAVNYVSARDLLLMQVFMTASLWSYGRMRVRGTSAWRWTATLVLFALALLSKMGAAVMPALVIAYDVVVLRSSPWQVRTWMRALPFGAVVVALVAYTSLVLGHSDAAVVQSAEFTPIQYGLTQAAVHLWHYGRNFIWPVPIRQAPEVPTHLTVDLWVISGALAILASGWVAWRARHTRPAVSFGIVAYWLLSLPESSVLPLWAHVTDYRPYAGSAFLFAAVVVPVAATVGTRVRTAMFVVVLAYLIAMTRMQNTTWRSDRALWEHSVQHGGSALAYLNLAMSYREPEPRERLLRESLRLAPHSTVARVNLGLALLDQGKTQEGLVECEAAVTRDPRRAQGHHWLAVAYERTQRLDAGVRAANEAVRLEPHNLEYRYVAARLEEKAGKYVEALQNLQPLVQAQPAYKDTWFLEAWARQSTGDTARAESAYRTQLQHDAAHVQARFNLAYLLMQRGALSDAVQEFEQVIVLQPSYTETHLHLATCLERLGRVSDAAEHRRRWESRRTSS